ncbi:glycosyltransferase [Sphingobacterium multivorum]|uniref:glycosyltransferase n=1 Tax=Sphingobacterium multivorum TaxID=28454 RepID=UPI0031BB9501
MKNKIDVIFLDSVGISNAYGIGAYGKSLVPELAKSEDINLYHLTISYGPSGSFLISQMKGYKKIVITFNNSMSHTMQERHLVSLSALIAFNMVIFHAKIDVGILHVNLSADFEICKVAKNHGFKVILTQHVMLSPIRTSGYQGEFTELNKKFFSMADGTIFLSDKTLKTALKDYKVDKRNAVLIYNGIKWRSSKSSKQELKRKYGFRSGDFILLYVGRIDESKGVFELLRAFSTIGKSIHTLRLVVVGSGDITKAMSISKNIVGKISYTGFVDRQMLAELYKIADLGILPSYSEQCSMAAIEMLHNNIPLILSDIEGFDVFADQIFHKAKIIKKKNQKSVDIDFIMKKIVEIYESSDYKDNFIKVATHYKKHVFNLQKAKNDTLKFYNQIFYS